jgi:hypothetical protein
VIPKRVKRTALIACAVMGVSILSATAWVTTSATAASANAGSPYRAAVKGLSCTFYTAIFGDQYVEPVSASVLDWTVKSRTQGTAVRLGYVSPNSLLNCFHPEGNIIPGGGDEFELANSSLCLNIAGASRSDGARAILYVCNIQKNEVFFAYPAEGGVELQNRNSGLCLDLTAGDSTGSIVDQEPCNSTNLLQAWDFTGSA